MYGPNIGLDDPILQDTSLIATGGTNASGDNSVAFAIVGIKDEAALKDGQSTFNEYYNSIIGEIGIKSKKSNDLEKIRRHGGAVGQFLAICRGRFVG